jgi:UDP-N-acetylmuramyl tripeptide synthase
MIAINDQYADGRDMSWLWDVDFSSLKQVASVSGIRAYDMALRLRYQSIGIGYVNTNLALVIDKFINTKSNEPMQIFATYTAMLEIRKIIKKYPKVGINS